MKNPEKKLFTSSDAWHSKEAKKWRRRLQFHHFVTSAEEGTNPFPSNRYLQMLKPIIIEEHNPILLGIFIHAVADSYSHQGFNWDWKIVNMNLEQPYIFFISPPIGHAQFLDNPDKPYNDPTKAFDMAMQIYYLLNEYKGNSSIEEYYFNAKSLKELLYFFSIRLVDTNNRSIAWKNKIKDEFTNINLISYNPSYGYNWNKNVLYYQLLMEEIFNFYDIPYEK